MTGAQNSALANVFPRATGCFKWRLTTVRMPRREKETLPEGQIFKQVKGGWNAYSQGVFVRYGIWYSTDRGLS